MNVERKVICLQNCYTGILADSVSRYTKAGILEKVTEEKRKEQLATGAQQAARFGATESEQVFSILSETYGCVNWEIEKGAESFTAQAESCKLCALAKKMGTGSPCEMYCLNPMEAMVKGLNPDSHFIVREKLWDGSKCLIEVID